jgi:hypothetical protein
MKLSPIPSRPLDHSDRRIFVWNYLKKSTRYHLSSGKAASRVRWHLVRSDISCEATSSRHRTYWGHESPMQSPSHTLAPRPQGVPKVLAPFKGVPWHRPPPFVPRASAIAQHPRGAPCEVLAFFQGAQRMGVRKRSIGRRCWTAGQVWCTLVLTGSARGAGASLRRPHSQL